MKCALDEDEKNEEVGETHELDVLKIREQSETINELRENLEKAKEEVNANGEENIRLCDSQKL